MQRKFEKRKPLDNGHDLETNDTKKRTKITRNTHVKQ